MNAKQKKCSILVFLLIGLLCTKAGYAETLLYKITASDKESDRKTVISKVENGYLVKSSNSLNKDESTFRTDLSFSILEWNLRSPGRGINVSAKRMNNIISVTGQIRDKQINEKFEIDSLPWYQEWGWGLRTHIISEKDTLPFWSLNSNFQQIAKFEAKKEKPEMFDLNGGRSNRSM